MQTLNKLKEAVEPGVNELSTLRDLAAAWSAMSKAHCTHSMHEDEVVFPVLEGFFPGQVCAVCGDPVHVECMHGRADWCWRNR